MSETNRFLSLVVRAWRSDDGTEIHARITEVPPMTMAKGAEHEVHRMMVGSTQIRAAIDAWLATIGD